jgi:hypothetical protein
VLLLGLSYSPPRNHPPPVDTSRHRKKSSRNSSPQVEAFEKRLHVQDCANRQHRKPRIRCCLWNAKHSFFEHSELLHLKFCMRNLNDDTNETSNGTFFSLEQANPPSCVLCEPACTVRGWKNKRYPLFTDWWHNIKFRLSFGYFPLWYSASGSERNEPPSEDWNATLTKLECHTLTRLKSTHHGMSHTLTRFGIHTPSQDWNAAPSQVWNPQILTRFECRRWDPHKIEPHTVIKLYASHGRHSRNWNATTHLAKLECLTKLECHTFTKVECCNSVFVAKFMRNGQEPKTPHGQECQSKRKKK